MCGNAIRCVAKYAYERGLVRKSIMDIETLSGVRRLELELDKDRVESVTVDMGVPILQPRLIPVDWADKDMIGAAVEIGGRTWNMTAVSMGNPHAVVFIDDPSEDIEELDLTRIGPLFEKHSLFPDRVNTEFVRIIDRQTLRMRVWERGAGETLACGTGSCASVAAAFLNGRCDRDVVVRLNGGDLKISWRAADQHMIMTGPAEFVFDGVYETEV
jgi:diaminopimelate epimerase